MTAGLQRIDRRLIDMGLISEDQIDEARLSSKGSKRPILDELIELGYLGDDDLISVFLSADPSLAVADLRAVSVDQSLLCRVPYALTQRHSALPIEVRDGELVVAMTNPWDLMATDDLSLAAGEPVRPVLAKRSDLIEAIERFYCVDGSVYDLCKHMQADDAIEVTPAGEIDSRTVAKLETSAGDAPVVRLVNLIIADGLKQNASDIHIEPTSEKLIVRYRIDGVLRTVLELPSRLTPAVTSRIKILAGMDIAERRKPQDGRIKVRRAGQEVDVRVSVIPVFTGEKAVLRLLTFAGTGLSLEKIGFGPDELSFYREMLLRPQGMLLVTGPTGSGKTSTIYASLLALNDGIRNITTVEDPVEYQLDGINQIQINEAAGVTFGSALRSILRQDPNVIFVGEIRDAETAEIAFRSAQTGHLVISTLHTNSAAAAYTRLLDIGIEPFLISSSLLGIVAQRLVRRLCPQCKAPYEAGPHELQRLGETVPPGTTVYRALGCAACSYSGYHGRMPVFEILPVTDQVKQLISLNRPETLLADVALEAGMKPLSTRAAELVLEGLTSAEEAAALCPAEIRRPAVSATFAAPAYDPNPAPKIAAPTVLIVDDDPAIRLLFRRTFGRDPIEIHEAEDGEQGLRLAHQLKPNLIILDVMMPVMDGIEACRRLKSSVEMANIPVILATARTGDEDEVEGLRAGADDYLVKPLRPEKLRLHVLKHLGRRYPALRVT
ncbi:MAG: type II/IV secretion system protein [Verrucomicrobia bacterium]|nr:type II/IV secretion system protein [Verrucomicrobiota bacterium]